MNPTPAVPPTTPFGAPPINRAVSSQFLETDIACRRCGYNLRGLREQMACPECGTAVGLSTRGDFLRYADPKWVETIARGVSLMLWGILAAIVAQCAGGGLGAATGAPIVGNVVGLLGGLISIIGVWLLTERDPGHLGEDRFARARRVTRFALVCGFGGEALQLFEDVRGIPPELGLVLGLLAGGLMLISVAGEYFKYLYIEHLASRIPDDFLTRRARFLRWGFVITLSVGVVFGAIGLVLMGGGGVRFTVPTTRTGTGNPAASGLGAVALAVAGIAFVLFAILNLISIFFLLRFSKRLREQAQSARLSWAAQAAGARTARPAPPGESARF